MHCLGWFHIMIPEDMVADLSPIYFRKQSATDGTTKDLNIGGFQGFGGLIQGQIYNPDILRNPKLVRFGVGNLWSI